MKRKLSRIEKMQIEHLKKRKDELIDRFIGACDEINEQIKDVREGTWLERKELTEYYDRQGCGDSHD